MINLPVAPTGFNALIKREQIQGGYPDLTRRIGESLGCDFSFTVVPQVRLALMFFDSREAGLFLPSSRNAERDRKAVLVPMFKLITLKAGKEALPQLAAIDDMRFQPVGGLPRSEVGAYLSAQTLTLADQSLLREVLSRAARDGSLLRSLQHYYLVEILRADVVVGRRVHRNSVRLAHLLSASRIPQSSRT